MGKLSGWRVLHSLSVWLGLCLLGLSPLQAAKGVWRSTRSSLVGLVQLSWRHKQGDVDGKTEMSVCVCVCVRVCACVWNHACEQVRNGNRAESDND